MSTLTIGPVTRPSIFRVLAGLLAASAAVPFIFMMIMELVCRFTGLYPNRDTGAAGIIVMAIYTYFSLLKILPQIVLGSLVGWGLRLQNPLIFSAGGAAIGLSFLVRYDGWNLDTMLSHAAFSFAVILTGAVCGAIFWFITIYGSSNRDVGILPR